EEQVDDGLATQDGHLLDRPLADLLERLGRVQDRADLLRAERLEADEVLAQVGVDRHYSAPPAGETSSTASRPSSSGTNTSTRSPASASTVRPTMSGWMGSSRRPRSTSTQR